MDPRRPRARSQRRPISSRRQSKSERHFFKGEVAHRPAEGGRQNHRTIARSYLATVDSPQAAAAISDRGSLSRTGNQVSSSAIARRSHSYACARSVHFWAGRNAAVCRHSEAMVRYRRTFSKTDFPLMTSPPVAVSQERLCTGPFSKSLAGLVERTHGLRTVDLRRPRNAMDCLSKTRSIRLSTSAI